MGNELKALRRAILALSDMYPAAPGEPPYGGRVEGEGESLERHGSRATKVRKGCEVRKRPTVKPHSSFSWFFLPLP